MENTYGVLFYRGTSNIGDDIQTIASKRFLPKVDYVIDREEMDSFVSHNYERVKVIMNGWYFHKAENWPPSPFIQPKMLSMHFTDNLMIDGWSAPYKDVLEAYGREFLKQHEPVGCRDKHTEEIMDSLDIKNYFSSCLTTTIDLGLSTKKKKDIIYAVDVSDEVVGYIKEHTTSEVVVVTHVMTKEEQAKSFDERMEVAEALLTKYYHAKMVVTSRLHAALPCLSLETPVLLIEHDDPLYGGRLDTFYSFVNSTRESNLLNDEVITDFDKPKKNPTKYKKYSKQLIRDCEAFVNEETPMKKVSKEEYITWLEDTKDFQKKGLKRLLIEEHQQVVGTSKNLREAYKKIGKLDNKLNSIYYSRSYQWTEKLKKIIRFKKR